MKRPTTEPPTGFWGWVQEVVAMVAGVSVVAAIGATLYVLYMHRETARVESSECGRVVFVGPGGERWTYAAADDCELFHVGDRWVIEWNHNGLVEPVRRR